MSLSREEITNTVQQLVGPGFKVSLPWKELEYLCSLEWPYLELGLLQAALGQLVMHGASREKIDVWQKRIQTLSNEIEKKENQNSKLKSMQSIQSDVNFKGLYTEKKNNVVAIDKFYPNKPAMDEIPWDYNASLQAEQQQLITYISGNTGEQGASLGVSQGALPGVHGLLVTQNGDSNGNLQTERKNTRKNTFKNTLPPVTGRKFRE
jgi:hypothetical protein